MNNEELIRELESISQILSERAISVLREALHGDDPSRPAQEKKITQARRAIEKQFISYDLQSSRIKTY